MFRTPTTICCLFTVEKRGIKAPKSVSKRFGCVDVLDEILQVVVDVFILHTLLRGKRSRKREHEAKVSCFHVFKASLLTCNKPDSSLLCDGCVGELRQCVHHLQKESLLMKPLDSNVTELTGVPGRRRRRSSKSGRQGASFDNILTAGLHLWKRTLHSAYSRRVKHALRLALT